MVSARPLRSAPAQNTFPAPVSTTTRTSSIYDTRSSAQVSSSLSARVIAFTGGLSSVITAMWSPTSTLNYVSSFQSLMDLPLGDDKDPV